MRHGEVLGADGKMACRRRIRLGGVLDRLAPRSLGWLGGLVGRLAGRWWLSLDLLYRLPLDLLDRLSLDVLNSMPLDLLDRLPMWGLRNWRAPVGTTLVFAQRGFLDVFRTACLAAECLVQR